MGIQTTLGTLPGLKTFRTLQESSYDRTGGNNDYIRIEPGERVDIARLEGPGDISRIWMTAASPDPYILRNAVLRMYWDGEESASVEAPLGDFFGLGFSAYRHFTALPLGMSSGGMYAYFHMPFAESARIEIENQSLLPIYAFYYAVTWHRVEKLPDNNARFHAQWHRERAQAGRNVTLLEASGRGHYVGCNLNIQGTRPFNYWFLEGDEMIYVDGESHPPAVHGTGTEDYFNSGWYFLKGTFAGPYHGLTVKDPLRARISAYRFHIEDPIPFRKNIRVTIEHGGTNDTPGSDYSSTAYWYQTEPHQVFPPLVGPEDRLPKETLVEHAAKQAFSQVADLAFKTHASFRDIFEKK